MRGLFGGRRRRLGESLRVMLSRIGQSTASTVGRNIQPLDFRGGFDRLIVLIIKADRFLYHVYKIPIDTRICQIVSILLTVCQRYYKILI